jgi:hypothetical protein
MAYLLLILSWTLLRLAEAEARQPGQSLFPKKRTVQGPAPHSSQASGVFTASPPFGRHKKRPQGTVYAVPWGRLD